MIYHAAPPNPQEIFEAVVADYLFPAYANGPSLEERRRCALVHLDFCFRAFNTTCS